MQPSRRTQPDWLLSVLAGQERFDDAAAILSEALELWRSRYGNSHYEVAVQLHNLAAIQQAQGHYSLAEATLGEALANKRGILRESHPEIAAILNNLASVYSDKGRRREARECYDHAIEVFTQTVGKDHPSTVACIQNRHNLGENHLWAAHSRTMSPAAPKCIPALTQPRIQKRSCSSIHTLLRFRKDVQPLLDILRLR